MKAGPEAGARRTMKDTRRKARDESAGISRLLKISVPLSWMTFFNTLLRNDDSARPRAPRRGARITFWLNAGATSRWETRPGIAKAVGANDIHK